MKISAFIAVGVNRLTGCAGLQPEHVCLPPMVQAYGRWVQVRASQVQVPQLEVKHPPALAREVSVSRCWWP